MVIVRTFVSMMSHVKWLLIFSLLALVIIFSAPRDEFVDASFAQESTSSKQTYTLVATNNSYLTLNRIEFASSTDWFLIDGLPSPKQEGALTFRKYYLYVVDDKLADVGVANVVFFLCQRQHLDALVIHIPEGVQINTLQRDQWISRTDLRVLADDVGLHLEAEYIKGDFFIDLTTTSKDSLLRLMNSRQVLIEFGPDEERIKLYQADMAPNGNGNLKGYLREALPVLVKPLGGKNVRALDGQAMFRTCGNYKARQGSRK
jgi:hypothetical protein